MGSGDFLIRIEVSIKFSLPRSKLCLTSGVINYVIFFGAFGQQIGQGPGLL